MGSVHLSPELIERRKQLAKAMAVNDDILAVSTALSLKFLVPPGTIAKDWFNRERWMDKLIDLQDSEGLFREDLRELAAIIDKANTEYDTSDSGHVRLRALVTIRDAILARQDLYEKIGLTYSVGEDTVAKDKKEADALLEDQKLTSPLKVLIPGAESSVGSSSDSEENVQSEESDE